MKQFAAQVKNKALHPFSQEDLEILQEFKDNQVVTVKVQGVQKERSYQQLKLFWACCRAVAENTNDQHWNNKDKVAFQVKVVLQFVDMDQTIVDSKGNVHLHYRSISFKNLPHMEANNFFDRAFVVMAKKLSITPAQLLENAEV